MSVRNGVNERINDAGAPGQYGCVDVHGWVFNAVIEHVHYHERQEAQEETDEYQHHEPRQSVVVFVAPRFPLPIQRRGSELKKTQKIRSVHVRSNHLKCY